MTQRHIGKYTTDVNINIENTPYLAKGFRMGVIHSGEAMYISMIDFQWYCTKGMVFNSLIIHHLIMITCISYEIVFTISLPKLINIAPLWSCIIRVTDSIRHSNTNYSDLEWFNINIFWYWYSKYIFIADAGNYD